MSLERIIRPFVDGTSNPTPQPQTSKPVKSDNVIITVGGNGQVKTYQASYSLSVTRYMTKQEREIEKETEITGGEL